MNQKEKLLEKTLSVIKNNIDKDDIKTEVFSLRLDSESKSRSKEDYIKVCINRKEYGDKLDWIMDYFIKNEWYEDCISIKEYQEKLKKLQQNEKQTTSRVKTKAVKK